MQDQQLLNTFWDLADPLDEKRITGAVKLLHIVVTKQGEHENESEQTDGEDYCKELSYTLSRLIKGLASSRKGARQGYATALSEILNCINAVKIEDVFDLIDKNLEIKGNKQEQKGCVFGQIFAYIAIAQSGRLLKTPEDCLEKVTTELFKLSQRKGYLQDICTQAIVDIITQCNDELFKTYIWPVFKKELKEGWENCTPQRLLLIFACHSQFPDVVKSKFLKSHWSCKDLLHQDNFSQIAQILAETTINSHPNVHTVCDAVLSQLVKDPAKLESFWLQAVDTTLCASTHERKFLAFKLLEKTLPLVGAEAVGCLFSDKLVRCVMNHLANKHSALHEAAKQLVENLSAQMKDFQSGEKQMAILTALLNKGGINFDNVTKSKTITSLVNGLNLEGIQLYISWLKSTFNEGAPESRGKSDNIDADRKWACGQLLYLVRHAILPRQDDWLLECTRFMFLHAFFTIMEADDRIPECQVVLNEPVSESVRTQLSQYFFSALNVLSNIATPESQRAGRHARHMGTTSEGQLYVYEIVMYIQELLTNEHCHLATELSEETVESWNRMLAAVDKIHKKSAKGKTSSEGCAFQLLYLHTGLQLFREPKQAVEILEDLQSCQDRALQKRKSLRKKQADEEEEDEEPEWIEVVTEILLSLLSQQSHLLRVVVDIVFKIICPHLTKNALQLLLDVLDPSKSKAGEGTLEVRGEGESDSEEEGDEEGDDEDEEQLMNGHHGDEDGGDGEGSDEEEEGSEDDDDNDDDDDDDEEEEEDAENDLLDEEFRKKMMETLGVNADEESGSGSDEEDEVSDSEMFKRDELLASMLRERATRRKQKAEAKTMMVHFKLRVLDMLDIFIKKQPTNPLVLELLHPLLLTIQSASHYKEGKLLAEKASTLYKNKLCRMRKYPHDIQDERDHLHQVLEDLFKFAHKATSVHMVSLASSGCLFLVRVLRGNVAPTESTPASKSKKKRKSKGAIDDEARSHQGLLDVAKVSELYRDALKDFLSRRESHLHPLLFTELIERLPELGWCLADLLVKYVKDGVQLYRKTQACKMLTTLMGKSNFKETVCTWEEFFTGLCDVSKEILQEVSENKPENKSKPKYPLEVIRMMQALVKLSKSMNKDQAGLWKDFVLLLMKLEKVDVVSRSSEIIAAVTSLRGLMTEHVHPEIGKKNKKRKRKKQKHRGKSEKTE